MRQDQSGTHEGKLKVVVVGIVEYLDAVTVGDRVPCEVAIYCLHGKRIIHFDTGVIEPF
jgi:hypothetical protein